ncbi:MAG: DUF4345 family protein [Flavisolibacter sp.]
MDKLSRFGIWLNRVVLVFVSVLFTIIALKSILHPLESSAVSDISLGSATAFSVVRVSMGAFPLSFAIITLTSIFSKRQIFRGIFSVFIIAAITTIVRIISLVVDGHSDFGQKVLVTEILLTILSIIGLLLELRREKKQRVNS